MRARRQAQCPFCRQRSGIVRARHDERRSVYGCVDTLCGEMWTGPHPLPLELAAVVIGAVERYRELRRPVLAPKRKPVRDAWQG